MAGLPVAVLDADVLVPILSCDLLLSSFDHGLYQPVVTRRILDEVTRSLAVDFPALDRPAIARRVRQVAVALAFNTEKEVAASEAVAGVNAKDRHVALRLSPRVQTSSLRTTGAYGGRSTGSASRFAR